MPPKGKKTKAEEARDFLSNLDNLDESPVAAAAPESAAVPTGSTPRASIDSNRQRGKTSVDLSSSAHSENHIRAATPTANTGAEDEEAQKALDFLEAQIKTKRAPLSAPKTSSRPTTPATAAGVSAPAVGPGSNLGDHAPNVPSTPQPASAGGWGMSSLWSTATSAIQSAQKIADEQYKKVKTEGYTVTDGLEQLKGRGVDLDKLRKGAEERLGGLQGYVKGVDLEKLRKLSLPLILLGSDRSRTRPIKYHIEYVDNDSQHGSSPHFSTRDTRVVARTSDGWLFWR